MRSAADDRCLTEHGFVPDRPVYTHCKGRDKAPNLATSSARPKKAASETTPAKHKETTPATALSEPAKVKSSRRPLDQYKGIIIRAKDGREVRRSNPFATFALSEAQPAPLPASKSSRSDSSKTEVPSQPSTSSAVVLGRRKIRIVAKNGRQNFVDVALPPGLAKSAATDVQSVVKSARSSTTLAEKKDSTLAKWAEYKAIAEAKIDSGKDHHMKPQKHAETKKRREAKPDKKDKPVQDVKVAPVVSEKHAKKTARPEKQTTQEPQELTPDDSISQVKMSGALPTSKYPSRVISVEPPSVPPHDSGIGLSGIFDTASARGSGASKAGSKVSKPSSASSTAKKSALSKTIGVSVVDWGKVAW